MVQPQSINSTLKHLVQNGHFIPALERYTNLWNTASFRPDNSTFPYILKASAHLKHPISGLLLHTTALKTGFHANLFVANSLILFYAKFSQLHILLRLFDEMPHRNVVTWTAAISALSQNHHFGDAIQFFCDMLLVAEEKPNSFTLATVLPCFSYGQGPVRIHSFVIKSGFGSDVYVLTSLSDAYAKCGSVYVPAARRVFNEMPEKNVVSWNAMLSGYNQNGDARASLQLFAKMRNSGDVQPDSFSVVTALNSCSLLTALRNGEAVHGYACKVGLHGHLFVANGLVDMYGKCGVLQLAEQVFYEIQDKDVSSWTALITCYGFHGQGYKAISTFEQMKRTTSIGPNSVTLTALLTACSHSCLVQAGLRYFEAMATKYCIEPTVKHYACIVDLLGRAGFLQEALKFISKMPIQADGRIWESLLGAATIQGEKEVTAIAAKNLLKLQSENSEVDVQLANIHAKFGWWEKVEEIRATHPRSKLYKKPGLSFVTK